MKDMMKMAALAGAAVLSLGIMVNAEDAPVRVGAMSGPTAMGMMKLMNDAEEGTTANTYEFAELSTDPSAFVAPLAKGEIDIAAVPANLASVIYNNTEGGVQVLAVNVLGVLNIVERGESIQSVADLKGKTIYATGKGSTPEYTLRFILSENGIDPDKDVTIEYKTEGSEIVGVLSNQDKGIAMLPQPYVEVAKSKVEGLKEVFDLTEEWEKIEGSGEMVTGVLVVRKQFAEENPSALSKFLGEYEKSASWVNENNGDAAALIEKYGIANAAVAEKALPECNITFISGADQMKEFLGNYLSILYNQNPKIVGGSLPDDGFYMEISQSK